MALIRTMGLIFKVESLACRNMIG